MPTNLNTTLKLMRRQDEEETAKALAQKANLGYVNLIGYPVLYDVLINVPEDISQKYSLVSYLKVGGKLKIATSKPLSPDLKKVISQIEQATNSKTVLMVCSESSIHYVQKIYSLQKHSDQDQNKVNVSKTSKEDFTQKINNLADLKDQIFQVPATKILNIVFSGASGANASDVHLEPSEKGLRVRFRIDGVLQDVISLPPQTAHILNSRIKYLSKLKLDITDKPQDGRFEVKSDNLNIDIRVSVIPSAYGETIVMRLLPKDKEFLTLQQLGFRPEYIEMINKAILKPNGIIFNTGPTGSGKTTTNYAILSKLNKPEVKIITLEDPIEYKIEGINQTQVEEEKGYSFAMGLRSVLRQDPDIIMVGEIRDEETATIAMQSAMTGHLVLTTLHTNSAPGAIPRLLDIGVKPYLMGGSINLVIAQRLVRKIHQECQGKGCKDCNNTGFKGRVAIAELLIPDSKMEKLIVSQNVSIAQFEDLAKSSGMMTMYEDGMDKVKQGITTKEEVLRVTQM